MLPRSRHGSGCSTCIAKLDRVGWRAGIAFASHGARIGVRVTDPAVLDRVREHLPPGSRPAASPLVDELYSLVVGGTDSRARRFHLLYAGAARLARSLDLDEVLETLEEDLHATLVVEARHRLFVDAGVVGWNGKGIVILGPERGGRTSLVAALVRAGAAYYSDTFAVFDPQGRVHPYPTPLSMRHGTEAHRRKVRIEEMGGRPGRRPLPVGVIVSTEYVSGAGWAPRERSPGQAVLALLTHAKRARSRPAFTLDVLGRVAATARTVAGERGEAEGIAAELLRHPEMRSRRPTTRSIVISPVR